MELQCGDPENLEGRVITYSRFGEKQYSTNIRNFDTGFYVSFFASTDYTDVKQRLIRGETIDTKCSLHIDQELGVSGRSRIFFTRAYYPGKSSIIDENVDVLRISTNNDMEKCIVFAKGALKAYANLLAKQNAYRHIRKDIVIPEGKVGEFLFDKYLSRMVNAAIRDKPFILNRLKEDIKKAIKKHPTIYPLYLEMEKQLSVSKSIDFDILHAHVQKIISVEKGDYENAAYFRDKIKRIS